MMAMARGVCFAAVAAVLAVQLAVVSAVDHPVGGDGSWDASDTNYNAWASKQKIVQGDTISFKYPSSHDVVEVTKAGYDACSGSNPVKKYSDGATTVKLTAPGKRYFICGVPGHCAAGMKLEVTVAAATTTPAAPAPTRSKSTDDKPSHKKKKSAAPAPAPAAAGEAASEATPSTDGVSTPTEAPPAPAGSSAAATVGVGAKGVVTVLAAGVALALLAM